jgi:recombination protein RecA
MNMKSDDTTFGEERALDKRSITNLITKITKKFGESVEYVSKVGEVETTPTGSLVLDLATGIGGYPRGRIITLAGWESSGKTTHTLMAAAAMQRQGGTVAIIDTEYSLYHAWMEKLGVDTSPEKLFWFQGADLEAAGDLAVMLAEEGSFDMIIFDSVAGAPIKAQLDGDLGDSNMGKRAKIMSTFMPKLNGPVAKNNIVMLFTNQLRDSLNQYNPKPVSPGGHALKFHSSMIIELRSKHDPKAGVYNVTAKFEKNKLSTPGKVAQYVMTESGEIDPLEEIVTILTTEEYREVLGVDRPSTAYFVLPSDITSGEPLKLNGRNAIKEALADDAEMFRRAEQHIRSRLLSS